jgi:hypothetical protein
MNNLKKTLAGIVLAMMAMTAIYAGHTPVVVKEPIKRTWNSDHYRNEDRTITASIKPKWINYMEVDESWQPIDNYFVETDEFFLMDSAPFMASAPLRSTGMAVFHSNNLWDLKTKSKIEEESLNMGIVASGVSDVPGKIKEGDLGWGETNYILYEDAYPEYDADLIYVVHKGVETRLKKLVRFNNDVDIAEDVQLEFDLVFSDKVETKHKGKKWDERNDIVADGLAIRRNPDSPRGIGLHGFYVWSDWTKDRQKIDIEYKKVGQGYKLIKIIPNELLNGDGTLVYTDASASFNPDASPESTSVDGAANRTGANLLWSDVHDNAGTGSQDSSAAAIMARIEAAGVADRWANIYRGIFLFDTSSLGAGATVSAADFKWYSTFHSDDFGSMNISLVDSTPASNTAVGNADYGNVGTTKYASDKAVSSISDSSYNTMSLNATGISNVVVDGITKLGLRMTNDVSDTAPTWGGGDQTTANGRYADNGSDEPTLDVTYTPVAADTGNMFQLF